MIILYSTIFCLAINFIFGKLRLISVLCIYPLQKKRSPEEPALGISVIICSRNDLQNLQQNLSFVLEQEYPLFEVIVVNDASTDGTKEYLDQLHHSHLRVIHINEKIHPGKKFALKKGTETANYPIIMLTDADCKPLSKYWLQSHAKFTKEENNVILGYGKYEKQKGLLNMLIRYDTAVIATRYMNSALWKRPYMGVGRNMGYSRNLSGNLEKLDPALASGDDDLFIQAVSSKADFKVNLQNDSFTTSKPKESLNSWLNQKGRHNTTAPKYPFITQASIMLQWFISTTFYLGFIIILLTGEPLQGLILFSLNLLIHAVFNGIWFKKLGEKDLILSGPFLDFIYTFVQPVFVMKSWGRKTNQWN